MNVRLGEEILEFYVREASSRREMEKPLLPASGPHWKGEEREAGLMPVR